MLTLKQKRAISKFVRENLESRNPRNVRFGDDGAVTVMVDEMPNTNKAGRIFAGWDTQLIKQIAAQSTTLPPTGGFQSKGNTMKKSFWLVEACQVTPAAQDTPFNGVDNVLVFARTAFEAAVIAKAYKDGKTLVGDVAADDGQTVAALSASDSMIATWIQYGVAAELLNLVSAEGCVQVTADVYLQTRENLQAAQEDWGPEDKAADSDFSVARFWITTDSDEPVPVEDKEDSELLALVTENLEEITNIIKWYKSGDSVNTNRSNLRSASLI